MKTFKIKEQKIIFNYLKQNIRSLSLDRYDQCFQKNLQLTAGFTPFFWGWMGEGEKTLPKRIFVGIWLFFQQRFDKKEWVKKQQTIGK